MIFPFSSDGYGITLPKGCEMSIGERVKKLRTDRGWTQVELSVYADVGINVITRLEKDDGNKSDLRLSSIRSLAKVFGMTISQLLEGVD